MASGGDSRRSKKEKKHKEADLLEDEPYDFRKFVRLIESSKRTKEQKSDSSISQNSFDDEVSKLAHIAKMFQNRIDDLEENKKDGFSHKTEFLNQESNFGEMVQTSAPEGRSTLNFQERAQRSIGKKRNVRHADAISKRDNVRKELNSSFPVRRHYEAEGRANEETVVPTPGISNARTTSKKKCIQLSECTLSKIRQVKNSDLNDACNELVYAYLEQDERGVSFSERDLNCHLDQLLQLQSESFEQAQETEYTEDLNGYSDIEELEENQDIEKYRNAAAVSIPGSEAQQVTLQRCERVQETEKTLQKTETIAQNLYKYFINANEKSCNLNTIINSIPPDNMSRKILETVRGMHFTELLDAATRNVPDVVCSSGEKSYVDGNTPTVEITQSTPVANRIGSNFVLSTGENVLQETAPNTGDPLLSFPNAYLSNINPNYIASTADNDASNIFCQREDFVFRPNEPPRFNRNLHKEPSTPNKKINISNKMGRNQTSSSVQNSSSEQLQVHGQKENLDSMSGSSFEPNFRRPTEMEHKTILNILKRDKKSEKIYDRNAEFQVDNNSCAFESTSDSKSAFSSQQSVNDTQPIHRETCIFPARSHQRSQRIPQDTRPKINENMRLEEDPQRPDLQNMSAMPQSQQLPLNFVQQLLRQVQQIAESFQASSSINEPLNCESMNLNTSACMCILLSCLIL